MPLYTHDCTECTFLGSAKAMGQDVDIYLSCDKSSYPFIVRYNSEGSEYATVDVGSAMYRTCCEVRDDPNRILTSLQTRRDALMRERERVLDRLVELMGEIDAAETDIEDFERDGWMDTELAAMESEAENGVAY